MPSTQRRISASQASQQLGVSTKALRIYEGRGLMRPGRSEAGYRMYSKEDLERGREIVALRGLGLSLGQVGRALSGERRELAVALSAREAQMKTEFLALRDAIHRVRALRTGLQDGQPISTIDLTEALRPTAMSVSFALPWPWDGEDFQLNEVRRINYIVGPFGSGKTRFARSLAASLTNGAYLGLDRCAALLDSPGMSRTAEAPVAHAELGTRSNGRVKEEMAWLLEERACDTPALRVLVSALEDRDGQRPLVVDMVEEGLDQPTQEALMQYLRKRARPRGAPVFLMTRSSSILDLALVGPDETILLCPANHAVPIVVAPYAGASGYEVIETCLGTPQARARLASGLSVQNPSGQTHK